MFYADKPVVIDILVPACASHDVGLRGERRLCLSPPRKAIRCSSPTGRSECLRPQVSAARRRQPLSFANLVANRWYLTVT